MKTLGWALILSMMTLASAALARAETRRVVQGDLLYQASAIAPSEVRAVFLAEARASWMLSVECGAPPRDTRVYGHETRRAADGTYAATAELGTPIADCETLRASSPEARRRRAQPELARMAAYYVDSLTGASPRPASAVAAARMSEPAPSLPLVLWTDSQEASHRRAIELRLRQREQERRAIAAQARSG